MPFSSDPVQAIDKALTFTSRKKLADIIGVTTRTLDNYRTGRTKPSKLITMALNDHFKEAGSDIADFKTIDLFAGIGGLRKGFAKHGGQCVFTSEWNKFSVQTYKANFPDDHEINGDITTVDAAHIPDHDVLLAGFPCQPFSLAGVVKKASLGRKHGFEDETQGTLFFDVARILEEKRPKAFLLENVKNLVSHDKGRTFQVILKTLRELGYETVEHKVISSAPWVPQKRERIFIAGFLEETPFNFSQLAIPDTPPTLRSILHEHYDTVPEEGMTELYRGKIRALDKYTLSDKLWAYLQNYSAVHKAKGNGFGCSVVGPDDVARTLSARYYKDGSEILIRQGGKNPRMLTPRECSRLMGYDRPLHQPLKIPVSNAQAYRQFGNGVCVPVIEAIARSMTPHITGTFDTSRIREKKFALTSE